MNNEENSNSKSVNIPPQEEYFIADYMFNEDESIVVLAKPRDYGMLLKE